MSSVLQASEAKPFAREKTGSAGKETGLKWRWHVLAFLMALLLLLSRRPDAVFHAQFFAEDGHVWFADAYNGGWFAALFRAQDGYFQTLPRLAAGLSMLVPVALAPLAMNVAGIFVQLLPVPLLLSGRLAGLGSLTCRAVLAFVYVGLPNCFETNVAVTDAQWHLALIVCLLLVAAPPRTRAWKVFDASACVLCALTGPFTILFVPVAAIRYWLASPWKTGRVLPLVILSAGAALQAYGLLVADASSRPKWPLGASVEWFLRILAGQIYLGSMVGKNDLASLGRMPFLLVIAIAGSSLMVYCCYKARIEWKLILLFAALLFAASLRSPMSPRPPAGVGVWRLIAGFQGFRYWFFPTLAFSWTCVWFAFEESQNHRRRLAGTLLLCLMLVGVLRDWKDPAFEDMHFASYVGKLQGSSKGTVVVIPENPAGWDVQLVRR
jgi:hypothetical protein